MKKQFLLIVIACIVSLQYLPICGMDEVSELDMDDVQTLNTLSTMCRDGNGVEKNENMALELHKTACTVAQEVEEADELFDKGQIKLFMQQGLSERDARYALAYAYEHGRGIPQNRGKALRWYREAAASRYITQQLQTTAPNFIVL